jgi:hypothetical protein
MANTNNNPGITDDDIKKTKEYTDALDKLNSSITGVNTKLPAFADGMEAGFKALAEKLPEVVDSMMKLNVQNRELAANGQKPISVFSQLASSLLSWNNLVSVGITLLVTYGGTIINWVADMLKGQTTLTALGKAMKDNAIIMDAIIQTRIKGNQAAQGELTNLTALYRQTQNHNLTLIQQKEAVKALKDQWPETFKGLSDQQILAGKAADAYKNLKDQIIATAFAEAARNKITANASRTIDNKMKLEQERAHYKSLAKQKEDLEQADKTDTTGSEQMYATEIDSNIASLAASAKIIRDLKTDQDLLTKQNDAFYKEIDKGVKKFGVNILGYKKTSDKPEQNIAPPPLLTNPASTPRNSKPILSLLPNKLNWISKTTISSRLY